MRPDCREMGVKRAYDYPNEGCEGHSLNHYGRGFCGLGCVCQKRAGLLEYIRWGSGV